MAVVTTTRVVGVCIQRRRSSTLRRSTAWCRTRRWSSCCTRRRQRTATSPTTTSSSFPMNSRTAVDLTTSRSTRSSLRFSIATPRVVRPYGTITCAYRTLTFQILVVARLSLKPRLPRRVNGLLLYAALTQ